ncbi:chemotaxis protein, partial [Candidatus Riflebacteria bacterium]
MKKILDEVEDFLAEKIGLASDSIGSNSVRKVVNKRIDDCRLMEPDRYIALLKTDPLELEELIERIVVKETWFFRDEEPFAFLKNWLMTEWKPKN